MTVWMKYEPIGGGVPGMALTMSLAIMQRGDPAAMFSKAAANQKTRATATRRTTADQDLSEGSRHVCLQSARPDVFESVSAEEGGDLILDRGKDRDTLMVYLDDSLTMVKRANRGKQLRIKFGADDRVFLLRRTDMKDCAAVEEAVTKPEPGVRRMPRRPSALTPNKAAIRVRRTNSGPEFRGKMARGADQEHEDRGAREAGGGQGHQDSRQGRRFGCRACQREDVDESLR